MIILDSRSHEHAVHYDPSELIGLAYEAASETDLWPAFFAELDTSLSKRVSTLVIRGFGHTRYVSLGATHAGFATLNPVRVFETKGLTRGSFAMAHVGREFVEDWSQLQIAVQDASGPNGEAPSAIEVFAGESSNLEREDRETLRAVLPHLHRALGVHFKVETLQSERASLHACLDELSDGVFLLDDKATVLHANHAAGVYLASRGGITYDEGQLRASTSDDDIHFRLNLKRVTSGRSREVRGKRLESGETLWMRGLGADRAVVFIGGKRRARAIAPELLEEALGITPAEARVGALFAAGQSLADIAKRLGISLHTVRVHLKKIQAKTGAHRQASLVGRMLEALPRVVDSR